MPSTPWSSPPTPTANQRKLDERQKDALICIYALLRERIDDPLNEIDPFKANIIYDLYMQLDNYYKEQYV